MEPSANQFGGEELNLDNEGAISPNRQMREAGDDQARSQVKQLAKRRADSVDTRLQVQVPMGTLMQMAAVAPAADLFTSGGIIDTSRNATYARLPPGQARAFRMLIAAGQRSLRSRSQYRGNSQEAADIENRREADPRAGGGEFPRQAEVRGSCD